jgi:hypothetical protein
MWKIVVLAYYKGLSQRHTEKQRRTTKIPMIADFQDEVSRRMIPNTKQNCATVY